MANKPNAVTTSDEPKKVTSWRQLERGSPEVVTYEAFKIHIDLIQVKAGFNPRDMNKPETQAKLLNLEKAYERGDIIPPIQCKLLDNGKVEVIDGECRYTAAMRVRQRQLDAGGDALEHMIVMPFRGNDADQLLMTVTANEGEKLTPLECGEVAKRLLNMHWDKKRIAERLNFTESWLDRILYLANMPEAVKHMVNQGQVAADVALKITKKEGDNAAPVLQELIDKTPGEKVTKKATKVTPDKPAEDLPAEPREKPAKREKRHGGESLGVVEVLAKELPAFDMTQEEILDAWEYKVTLNGKAMRALLQVQAMMNQSEEGSKADE